MQKAFTPRTLASVEESVRERARRLIDAARETGGSCDFVEAFAAPLPLQVICDMLGIPEEDEEQVFHWTNVLLGVGDPEFVTEIDDLKSSAMAFMEYAARLGVERAEHPGDDLSSLLMQAEVDGERLTPFEFAAFFVLLAIAGNETTRNAISWGMNLLTEHPDQRALLQANYDGHGASAPPTRSSAGPPRCCTCAARRWPTRRWATPRSRPARRSSCGTGPPTVTRRSSRTAPASTSSAKNAADDGRFRRRRHATSAWAPTWPAARSRSCSTRSSPRLPDLEITGPPDRLQSNFINGIKRMPCEFTVR